MSFINFVKVHGPNCTLRESKLEDGTPVQSLRLTSNNGEVTYVGFSQKLGNLNAQQVLSRARELDVVSGTNKDGKLKHSLTICDGENIDFSGVLGI